MIKDTPNWATMSHDEKKDRVVQAHLLSDPARCPLRLRHPPNGIEFGIGCGLCINKDKSALTHVNAEGKTWSGNASASDRLPANAVDEDDKKQGSKRTNIITSVQQYARWKKEKVHKVTTTCSLLQ